MRGQVSNPCRARRLGAPSYRLGGLFRRRKDAGDSVERLSLVFRCRLFGGGRELGTPLLDGVFAAAGLKCGSGRRRTRATLRFSRRARCPHRAVPGPSGVPPLPMGSRNLIPHLARATARVAPTSTCLKPDGRVRTPAPTAYTKAVLFCRGRSQTGPREGQAPPLRISRRLSKHG